MPLPARAGAAWRRWSCSWRPTAAECGNLALRAVTTRGLYVGGGIAPKILPALQTGLFLDHFCAKPPMRELLESIPVKVILNPQAGLLGAAVFANAEVQA